MYMKEKNAANLMYLAASGKPYKALSLITGLAQICTQTYC